MKKSFGILILFFLFPLLLAAQWDISIRDLLDPVSRSISTISEAETNIHRGNYFRACSYFEAVTPGNNATFLVNANSLKHMHIHFSIASAADSIARIYESPIITDNGTERIPSNFNRDAGNPPDGRIFYGGAVSDNGDFLCALPLFGGEKSQNLTGSSQSFTEWVLQEDTWYLVKITNLADVDNDLFVSAEWYEAAIN